MEIFTVWFIYVVLPFPPGHFPISSLPGGLPSTSKPKTTASTLSSLSSSPPPRSFPFMGKKSLLCARKLRQFCRFSTEGPQPSPNRSKPSSFPSSSVVSSFYRQKKSDNRSRISRRMDTREKEESNRLPLSEVVSDCVRRWFIDTLKEARAGDAGMQVLVGQMYYSGYGVPRNAQKGKTWIANASRCQSSAWKVGKKRPGYNASDSDSDEMTNDMN